MYTTSTLRLSIPSDILYHSVWWTLRLYHSPCNMKSRMLNNTQSSCVLEFRTRLSVNESGKISQETALADLVICNLLFQPYIATPPRSSHTGQSCCYLKSHVPK